jgi:hypothetical protein
VTVRAEAAAASDAIAHASRNRNNPTGPMTNRARRLRAAVLYFTVVSARWLALTLSPFWERLRSKIPFEPASLCNQ